MQVTLLLLTAGPRPRESARSGHLCIRLWLPVAGRRGNEASDHPSSDWLCPDGVGPSAHGDQCQSEAFMGRHSRPVLSIHAA